jgi:DNA adenine methylase
MVAFLSTRDERFWGTRAGTSIQNIRSMEVPRMAETGHRLGIGSSLTGTSFGPESPIVKAVTNLQQGSIQQGSTPLELGAFVVDVERRNLSVSPDLTPFLKWPGGKSQELQRIAAAAPSLTGRYIDPFVGGGSVLLAVPNEVEAWANDAIEDLIDLYRAAAELRPTFRNAVADVAQAWHDLRALNGFYSSLADAFLDESASLSELTAAGNRPALDDALRLCGPDIADVFSKRFARDLPTKFDRMRAIQKSVGQTLSDGDLLANVEGAVRSAFYMSIRARYNRARLLDRRNDIRLADFLFLREFAYAAMFRFNSRGEFNVPYGGITYNRKSFAEKVDLIFSPAMLKRLQNTTWRCADFESFLQDADPGMGDLVFIDPPYDSDFSSYDGRSFGQKEQSRLHWALERLPASVMIVIKDTPLIRRLYGSDRWRIEETEKKYMWTIKSRNDRDVVHLTITNY